MGVSPTLVLDQRVCVDVVFEESETDCSSAVRETLQKAEVLTHTQHVEAKCIDSQLHLLLSQFYQPNISGCVNDRRLQCENIYQPQLKLHQRLVSGNLKL